MQSPEKGRPAAAYQLAGPYSWRGAAAGLTAIGDLHVPCCEDRLHLSLLEEGEMGKAKDSTTKIATTRKPEKVEGQGRR